MTRHLPSATKQKAKAMPVPHSGPATDEGRALRITDDGSRPRRDVMATHALSPQITAALTITSFASDVFKKETGISELVEELKAQVHAIHNGNIERVEGMLIAQAHSLDMIFAELARRAAPR